MDPPLQGGWPTGQSLKRCGNQFSTLFSTGNKNKSAKIFYQRGGRQHRAAKVCRYVASGLPRWGRFLDKSDVLGLG